MYCMRVTRLFCQMDHVAFYVLAFVVSLSYKRLSDINVDFKVVVGIVTTVVVVIVVAAIVLVFICRGRKRVELNYSSDGRDDKLTHSRESNYVVEGVVESVVGGDVTVCVDTQGEGMEFPH